MYSVPRTRTTRRLVRERQFDEVDITAQSRRNLEWISNRPTHVCVHAYLTFLATIMLYGRSFLSQNLVRFLIQKPWCDNGYIQLKIQGLHAVFAVDFAL